MKVKENNGKKPRDMNRKGVEETNRMLNQAANGKRTVSLILQEKKKLSLIGPKVVNRMKHKS